MSNLASRRASSETRFRGSSPGGESCLGCFNWRRAASPASCSITRRSCSTASSSNSHAVMFSFDALIASSMRFRCRRHASVRIGASAPTTAPAHASGIAAGGKTTPSSPSPTPMSVPTAPLTCRLSSRVLINASAASMSSLARLISALTKSDHAAASRWHRSPPCNRPENTEPAAQTAGWPGYKTRSCGTLPWVAPAVEYARDVILPGFG